MGASSGGIAPRLSPRTVRPTQSSSSKYRVRGIATAPLRLALRPLGSGSGPIGSVASSISIRLSQGTNMGTFWFSLKVQRSLFFDVYGCPISLPSHSCVSPVLVDTGGNYNPFRRKPCQTMENANVSDFDTVSINFMLRGYCHASSSPIAHRLSP